MSLDDCRNDFPILQKRFYGKPIIYFDNAAMTLKPRQVVEKMNEYYYEYSSVTGRSIHKLANRTKEEVEKARRIIQDYVNAHSEHEIIFTRNTSESINLVAYALDLKPGDVVLTTDREHNSNLVPWLFMQKKKGIRHDYVPSNPDLTFDMGAYEEKLEQGVKLVSMVWTSNLDGYTIPAKEVVKKAHEHGALVMLDAAQTAPHHKVDVRELDVDFLAFSVHKMCGPTGVGVLYGKKKLLEEIDGFIVGGDTVKDAWYDRFEFLPPPEKFEAGLQNYAGMIGAGAAAEYVSRIGFKNIEKREYEINKLITESIQDIPGVSILGPSDPRQRSGIVSIVVEGADPHDIAIALDETANIEVRSGRHCVHSWFNAHDVPGSVRASVYFYNTLEEAETFVDTFKKVLGVLRGA